MKIVLPLYSHLIILINTTSVKTHNHETVHLHILDNGVVKQLSCLKRAENVQNQVSKYVSCD